MTPWPSLLVFAGLLCIPAAVAREPSDPPETARRARALPEKPYGPGQLRADAVYLARRPFTLERRGRTKLYATAGATLALYLMRDEIRDWVQDHRSPGRSRFLDDVRTMGKGAFAPTLALIAFGSSFATKNEREKETAVLLLESMGYSAVAAYGGSFVLASERPEEGDGIRFLDADGHGVSLDAALAASVVEPLRRQYLRVRPDDRLAMRLWKRGATFLLYSGAVLTGYQRMDQDKHWAPDVFVGLSTGFGIGKMLCDSHDQVKRRKRGRFDVTLLPGGGAVAVRWTPRRALAPPASSIP